MFDMTKINKRFFEVTFEDGLFLSVESPKLKTLRKITDLAKDKDKDMMVENLCEALALALSKNKQKKKIEAEYIEENFDMDTIMALMGKYFEWVKDLKNDPN